jgi:hypothetical protein
MEEGETVTFDIYERDDLLDGDDYILTTSALVSDSKAIGIWDVDIDAAEIEDNTPNNYDRFYFKTTVGALQKTSNNLELIKYSPNLEECEEKEITFCEQYETKDSCEFNDCSITNFGDIDNCGQETERVAEDESCIYTIECACGWNETGGADGQGSCGAVSREILNECESLLGIYPSILGECLISQVPTNDNCDDGFLNYEWTALWNWKTNNYSSEDDVPHTTEVPIQTADGYWHYPTVLRDSCLGGQKIVPCPSSIALSFLGMMELLATVIVIALIYYFIFIFKKKKASKKKRSRK